MAHPRKKLAVSLIALAALITLFATLSAAAQDRRDADTTIINPAIDDGTYVHVAPTRSWRAGRHLSEPDFIGMSREPGTILLDARSKAKFDELHAEGAVNLSFPGIDLDSLARTLGVDSTAIAFAAPAAPPR